MNFIVDAQLPPGLRQIFRAAGHDAIHTLELPDQNAARDSALNAVSLSEQ